MPHFNTRKITRSISSFDHCFSIDSLAKRQPAIARMRNRLTVTATSPPILLEMPPTSARLPISIRSHSVAQLLCDRDTAMYEGIDCSFQLR